MKFFVISIYKKKKFYKALFSISTYSKNIHFYTLHPKIQEDLPINTYFIKLKWWSNVSIKKDGSVKSDNVDNRCVSWITNLF